MADNFGTLNPTTDSTSNDHYLLRQNGVDYKQSRETLAAGISNSRWINTVNYLKDSVVVAADGHVYQAVQASGSNSGGSQDPASDDGTYWKTYGTHPQNTFLDAFINTDQRGTFSNWSSVADGDYGIDVWKKIDASFIRQPIEDGYYLPNTLYSVIADGKLLRTVTSPTSGNWDSADLNIPIAASSAGLFVGRYVGEVTSSATDRSTTRYYWVMKGEANAPIAQGAMFSATSCLFTIPTPVMRDIPVWDKVSINNYGTLGAVLSTSTSDFVGYTAGQLKNGSYTLIANNMTGGEAGKAITLRFTAESFMSFDARL